MPPKKTTSKKPAKKRMGRPPKAPGERRDVNIRLRMRTDERDTIRAAAESVGETVTEFMVAAALLPGSASASTALLRAGVRA